MRAARFLMRVLAIALWVLALMGAHAFAEQLSLPTERINLSSAAFVGLHMFVSLGAGIAVWRYSLWAPWLLGGLGVVLVVGRITFTSPFGSDSPELVTRVVIELAVVFALLVGFSAWQVRAVRSAA